MIINNSIRCYRRAIRDSPPLSKLFKTISSRSLATEVTIKYQGPVACIGINRPHMKNCLTPHIAAKLKEEIEFLENNDNASVGVLYGERGTFSYGIHPNDLQTNSNIYEEILNTGLFDKFPRKPIVAAVSGYAIGLAFDLALWCDFRVTEDTAVLASYARNSGIPSNHRLIKRLVSCVGSHRALDWLLSGRPVKAKEGLEAGAITRIVACGTGTELFQSGFHLR
uniref:Putative enoyl-CoA hydratase n=1 Tax=Lygus hesperus TaxID=30085 RepID=A0A146LQ55_LYGHE